MTKCPTCWKPLKRETSRHKCYHGIWCGIYGRPQLTYRSRTCEECNKEIAAANAANKWLKERERNESMQPVSDKGKGT